MKKIKIIVPYFGNLPDFFQCFLQSAAFNKNIDFLIVSDSAIDTNASNVETVLLTFDKMRAKIQEKFDFQIVLDTPYKLTDYKPAFGYIFSDYLQGYDYWGFCDTDLIFGDIYTHLEQSNFFEQNYDKYGILGHFQIYKNNHKMVRLFMDGERGSYSLDYRYIYTNNYNFIFDETNGINLIANALGVRTLPSTNFDDIDISNFTFKRYDEDKSTKRLYSFSPEDGFKRVELENNAIKYSDVLYAHFQKRTIDCPKELSSDFFYVIPNKVLLFQNKLTVEQFLKFTTTKIYWSYLKYFIVKRFKKEKFSIKFLKHKQRMKNSG